MKLVKHLIIGFSVFFATTVISAQAQAALLSFSPSTSTIGINDPLDINLVISDLAAGSYVGAFDIDISFDAAVLTFDSYVLTDNLGVIATEALDGSLGDDGGGTVNVAEVSLLVDLSFQPYTFTLATLSFKGSNIGTSSLMITSSVVSDHIGSEIATKFNSGTVNVAPVPEPATMLLFGTGLLGLAGVTIRRKKK